MGISPHVFCFGLFKLNEDSHALSTHPHPDRRIDDLAEQMPAALEDYQAAPEQFGTGESF